MFQRQMSTAEMASFKLVVLLFVCIGLALALFGAIWSLRTTLFVRSASRVQGTVIEVERKTSTNGTSFHPIYTFKDQGGIQHTQATMFGSSSFLFEPGETVPI